MKFGKEFEAQMVQEWREAYMDYTSLKAIIKDISRTRATRSPPPKMASTSTGTLKKRVSLYRAFSGLTSTSSNNNYIRGYNNNEDDDEVILVTAVQGEGTNGSSPSHYQTRFIGDGHASEQMFFKKLDDEFNKVVDFYKGKVDEVVNEANDLNKQMDALIALRVVVDEPMVTPSSRSTPPAFHVPYEHSGHQRVALDSIQEKEMTNEVNSDEENQEVKRGIHGKINGLEKLRIDKPTAVEVLNHVKINVAPETPVSTLKTILLLAENNLHFSKQELKKAEDLMVVAFIEFYQRLRLLKSYSYLNIQAFSKILKKYDKKTSTNASKAYLKMVDNSYLDRNLRKGIVLNISLPIKIQDFIADFSIFNDDLCLQVNKLMKNVERAFIKHFANGNRQKGMQILRPKNKRERHGVSFAIGLFGGCSIALIVAILLVIRAGNIFNSVGRQDYMEVVFPLYSLFLYLILHLALYAGNIYYWRRYRVNYTFIFGFKNGTELGYREVLLVSSALLTLTLAGVLSNLDMQMDPRTRSFETITELVPLGLLVALLAVTICPFNVLYRSSRYLLLTSFYRCFLAPLYKVIMVDFFLADQLTSQVQAFRTVQYYVCYYGWGNFRTRSHTCQDSHIFEIFYYVVAIVPYWLRFIQCLRRLFEEKKQAQEGANALKYLSTIVAVAMRTALEQNRSKCARSPLECANVLVPTHILKIIALSSSIVAAVFNTYWDIVVDWGLLRKNSKHFMLRDKLLITNCSVYFIAMVVNVLLRLVWMQLVFGITEAPLLHRQALIAIVACLEIIRRGIWNFFRLENEHLNNVGNFRAFKSVPLPFNYDDDVLKDKCITLL